MDTPATILISGWRFIPHSYAVVNAFQCLELLRRRDRVRIYFEDLPYYNPAWRAVSGLFTAEQEHTIRSIGPLPAGVVPDAEYRIVYPYDLVRPPRCERTFVFGTAEYRTVPPKFVAEQVPVARAMAVSPRMVIVTPSNWSREGFLASGAPPERVAVVPHGVDESLFRPPTPQQRSAARAKLGIGDADDFVFLNLGAMTGNKGMRMLLAGFAQVLARHPTARLVLKGLDGLYASKTWLEQQLKEVHPSLVQRLLPRLAYIGQQVPFADVAQIYHLADCYVAPYIAEGFNLPVLEAAACGLPMICTAGGPTEDFITDDFALRIPSTLTPLDKDLDSDARPYALVPSFDRLVEQMLAVIEQPEFRRRARDAGPAHVHARFTWRHVVDQLLTLMLPGCAAITRGS